MALFEKWSVTWCTQIFQKNFLRLYTRHEVQEGA